jgi:hypothetical protein
MRTLLVRRVVWLPVGLALVSGCSEPEAGSKGSSGKGPAAVTVVSAKDLPELGEYLPPLDHGRIEVAGPASWSTAPRSNQFIARFTRSLGASYPSIIITAEDSENALNVNKGNVEKFASLVAQMRKTKKARPIIIGSFIGAESAGRAKLKDRLISIDLLRIDTAVEGRQYTVELRAREGEVDDSRRELYAVAGGLKFPEAAGQAQPTPEEVAESDAPADQKAQQEPAEKVAPAPAGESKEQPKEPSEKGEKTEDKPNAEEQPGDQTGQEAPTETEVKEEPKPSKKPKEKIDLDKELDGLFDSD